MDRSSQSIGTMLMAAAALQMVLFTLGVLRRSYLAVALPMFAAVSAVSALLFWVGYTMVNMEPDLGELDLEDAEEAEAVSA